ncbi:1073_t:CDS:2, partial [Paraglomus occultum]
VYPATEIISRSSQSQGNISQLRNNSDESRSGFPDQSSRMETDERSLQSHQQDRQADIKVGRPIGTGSYGVEYKATMKHTGMPIALKTLVWRPDDCEE